MNLVKNDQMLILAKSLFLFGFYLVQKYSFGFIIVCKQSQQIKHSNSNHSLLNTNENNLQKGDKYHMHGHMHAFCFSLIQKVIVLVYKLFPTLQTTIMA